MKTPSKEQLIEQVKNDQSISGSSSRDAFTELLGNILEESSEVQKFNQAYIQRKFGTTTVQIDGFDVDHDRDVITLFVMDYDESDSLFNDTFVTNVEKQVAALLKAVKSTNLLKELDPSEPILPCLQSLERFKTIHVRLFSLKEASSRLSETKPANMSGWDVQVFAAPCASVLSMVFSEDGQPIEVDFQGSFGQLIPCMNATTGDSISSWLAVIPGDVLAKIFDKYGNRLLESNVRSFLQFKGKINAGIRRTIEASPTLFFPFNNGLSATVTEIVRTQDDRHIRSLKGLQIVNGGQTTASLWRVYRDNKEAQLEQVRVMAKITCVEDATTTRDIVANISRFANSQNAVNPSDFFSNHDFHQEVERISKSELTPQILGHTRTAWFYERTRGSHANYISAPKKLTEQKKRKVEFPVSQRVDKIELAKIMLTFSYQSPHLVGLGGQKAFVEFAKQIEKQWDSSPNFVTSRWWQDRVAERLMFIHLTKLVSQSDWYRGGIRAQVVSYTLALLTHHMELNRTTFNRQAIWNNQDVDGEWLVYVDSVANWVHDNLVSTSTGNLVSEWTKSAECWRVLQVRGKQAGFTVPSQGKWIVDSYSAQSDSKAERAEAIVNKVVNAVVDVTLLRESGYWLCVRAWHEKSSLLSSTEYVLLNKILGNLHPTDAQAKTLMAIKDKAKSAGMVTKVDRSGKHVLVS
jgi:hypothetical protein